MDQITKLGWRIAGNAVLIVVLVVYIITNVAVLYTQPDGNADSEECGRAVVFAKSIKEHLHVLQENQVQQQDDLRRLLCRFRVDPSNGPCTD